MKKRLTATEEFEVMKLVLDKFLWIGLVVMVYGLYVSITGAVQDGLLFVISGIILLILFIVILVKEYEIIS